MPASRAASSTAATSDPPAALPTPTDAVALPTIEEAAWLRLTAWLLGLGAFGLVLTSACYALAGPQAALPGGATTAKAALAATVGAAGWMRAASLFGMPADLLLAVAAAMMARFHRDAPRAFAGWSLLALTSALFVLVDAMVGFVLPAFTASGARYAWVTAAGAGSGGNGPGALAAYAAMRALFDTLFLIGTWALGLGALAVTGEETGVSPRWVARALRLAGGVALLSSSAGLLGWAKPLRAGASIALAAAALAAAAVSLARRARGRVVG